MTKLLPKTHRRHPEYVEPKYGSEAFANEQMPAAQMMSEEMDKLWQLYKENPTDQLRNRLVERYMPIVHSRAERVWSRLPEGVELDDLISAGTFGLMDAIAAYDINRGVRFEAFCLPRVQGSMVDELRSMDWVPRMVRKESSKLNETIKRLEQQYGRKPSDQEVADELGISGNELHQLFAKTHSVNITSLDKSWSESDAAKDMRDMDTVVNKRSEDPTERLAKIDLVRSFTKGLNKTERMIVILYYYEELTMREIGAALEISESRVSQMHTAIVSRIKKLYGAAV
ncbi:MAG: FliA/WhiG family RNA polymerase sigma factor [Planctomycetaceae bacterium]|nr:FliA/WhiG family RNA polymerase sigma factor [Planctomycetaceae bacterium]